MNEQEIKAAEYFGKSLEKMTQKALDEERQALENTRQLMDEISCSVTSGELTQHYHNGEYEEHPRLKLNPNGFYVLIEMEEVKETSEGGIILHSDLVRKEQDACDIGYVRAVGNTAFIGMPGCNPSEYNPTEPQFKMTPAQIWGIDIGDKVEYRRHEGKVSGIPGNERMRYIPDTQIIGKVL